MCYAGLIIVLLCMGLSYDTGILAAGLDQSSELEPIPSAGFSLDRRAYALDDVCLDFQQHQGYTKTPSYDALEIHESMDRPFEFMAESPYYKIFFTGRTARISVGNSQLTLELKGDHGEPPTAPFIDSNSLTIPHALESVDLSYTLSSDRVNEFLTLREPDEYERIIYEIHWQGMTPQIQDDGSILFADQKKIMAILPPFMRDASGSVCTDLHYELIETESTSEHVHGWELHKVIDARGMDWLHNAQYPVVIDPTMETFEDAWESAGLHPYGQYFKNIEEYVNPATGYLTVTQTDLTIPGRGLDVVLSRVYETPAVFYGASPYDFESPPVKMGKGWSLNLPYVGTKYLHLWGGTKYKISWNGSTFINHTGSHFTLEKNGDNTYTLTTVDGMVYDFSTAGKITSIKDLDDNSMTFSYTSGLLTSITDTIGRTLTFTYNASNYVTKIGYDDAEIEYGYSNGCLMWMDDFLDRRTTYTYDTGYNDWLLSKIEYPTAGYTTYTYNRFTDNNYYKYHVTNQRVYETALVKHSVFSYSGNFQSITGSTITVKNGSGTIQGYYGQTITDGIISEKTVKNASGTAIRKFTYTHNTRNELTQQKVYKDGLHLSYTTYYAYDNWGNCIYRKNAEGHEEFFSYSHTSTSGYFVDENNTIIKQFTNAFVFDSIPSSVHTALLGTAEKQDGTYVKERYITYDTHGHPTQSKSSFGEVTTWMAFSGTFNEKTGNTSFPIDLTGHTVTGNAVLEISGKASDSTYQESHTDTHSSSTCRPDIIKSTWTCNGWNNRYFYAHWNICCGQLPNINCDSGNLSIGPFVHYPGTLGYQSYTTTPSCGEQWWDFTVTTTYKAYPVQVQYKFDSDNWTTLTTNLKNDSVTVPAAITGGSHTLYFSESSSKKTKFSWSLHVPVDNSLDVYTTSMQYDSYGNITSITDAQSNTITLSYSATYSGAYLTESSIVVGTDTITSKVTYDSMWGRITSIQQPKGVHDRSGYDYMYTYDLLGRMVKKEFPLLTGQQERWYMEAVYDDSNRTVTVIDPLRHYITYHYDKLGRVTSTKWYTGTYGAGTLYASSTTTYRYDGLIASVTDTGNDTVSNTYDFLGRLTQITFPDSSSRIYTYDDAHNKVTITNGRNYRKILWRDWLSRLKKMEEEYDTDTFATTTYTYDEIGNLLSFTDPETHTTAYTYGSLFGLTRIVYPDSEYETYTYDDVGNIASITDCQGNTTSYTYDDLHRLVEIEYEDQSTVSYTYDLNSNRTRMDDDVPSSGDHVTYGYDRWNRLLTETRNISQSSYQLTFQYDATGRVTSLTYPDSMQILYTYDDLTRITEIKRYINGENDEILFDKPQYNVENLLTQFDYGNDLQAFYTFDSLDQPSTIDMKDGSTSHLDIDCTYDHNGNITQLINGWRDTSSTWHSETESYSYDGLDRLTSASCTSWSHTYTYDKAGNRTGKDSLTYTLNSVNEVTALSDDTSFSYDDNGNRIQKTKGDDTWDYVYDYAQRLIAVEHNNTTIGEYTYGGNGKRLQKTENSTTTLYMHSGMFTLYEEKSSGYASYIYGPTGLLAKRTTIDQESNTYYYHKDHLGSTRLVTDSTKTLISAVTYHPFGNIDQEEGSEEHLFTGKTMDSSQLYYFGSRYYDAELGRFITRDSVGGDYRQPQSLNRYTYCLDNPLKYVDPDGRVPTLLHDIGQGPFSLPSKPEPPPTPILTDDAERNMGVLEEHKEAMEEYKKKLEWWEKEYGGTVFGKPCDCQWTLTYQFQPPEYPIDPETMLEEVVYHYIMNSQTVMGQNASFSGEYEMIFIMLASMGFVFDSLQALIEYIENLTGESEEPQEKAKESEDSNAPPTEPKEGEEYIY